jgi:phosphate transport system protein
MSRPAWHRPQNVARQGRAATRAQIIETIDRTAPETKSILADEIGISEQYLSEHLQELKRQGLIRKAYVVDEDAVYANAGSISGLGGDGDGTDAPEDTRGAAAGESRGAAVLELLGRLDDVTATQFAAASETFQGEEPERPPSALESLANERYGAVLAELKSYTLTTDWPGNRVAADLATVATNLEIVGDRACFIADEAAGRDASAIGVVEKRICDIFESGRAINELFGTVAFDCDLEAYEQLVSHEETVHRDLDELFELVTAYDPDSYAHLVTVMRALERAIFYWVHSAEIAVRLHSGVEPGHAMI